MSTARRAPTVDEMKERIDARDHHIRESWVTAMEARLVRAELQKCHRGEGVNHYANCKELAARYTEMIRDNKIKGYKMIDEE